MGIQNKRTKRKRGGALSMLKASMKREKAATKKLEETLREELGLPNPSRLNRPSMSVSNPKTRQPIESIFEQLRDKYKPETLESVSILLGTMLDDSPERIIGIIKSVFPFDGHEMGIECRLSPPKKIVTTKTVHLWINTHGLETDDRLPHSLPSCSAVGQRVGFTTYLRTNISVNLTRLNELRHIYRDGPLHQQMQAAQEVFIPLFSNLPWERKIIGKPEWDEMGSNFKRVYQHDRSFSVTKTNPIETHSLGIFVIGTNLPEGHKLRKLLETPYTPTDVPESDRYHPKNPSWSFSEDKYRQLVPVEASYIPIKRTNMPLEQYLEYQKWNLLNLDYLNQIKLNGLGEGLKLGNEKGKVNKAFYDDGMFERLGYIRLSSLLKLFGDLGFTHVNLFDTACRSRVVDQIGMPPRGKLDRQVSKEEKKQAEEMLAE